MKLRVRSTAAPCSADRPPPRSQNRMSLPENFRWYASSASRVAFTAAGSLTLGGGASGAAGTMRKPARLASSSTSCDTSAGTYSASNPAWRRTWSGVPVWRTARKKNALLSTNNCPPCWTDVRPRGPFPGSLAGRGAFTGVPGAPGAGAAPSGGLTGPMSRSSIQMSAVPGPV